MRMAIPKSLSCKTFTNMYPPDFKFYPSQLIKQVAKIDRSPESSVLRSNVVFSAIKANHSKVNGPEIFANYVQLHQTWPIKQVYILKKKKKKADILVIHKPNLTSSHFKKTYKWAMETRGPKLNSSELLCLSWLPATLMTIRSKMKELAWRHHFPIISLWVFFRPEGQLTP